MITSGSNVKVKEVAALQKQAKERKKRDVFIVEGPRMYVEAPVKLMKEVYISESYEQKLKDSIKTGNGSKEDSWSKAIKSMEKAVMDRLKQTGYEVVKDDLFEKMSDTKTPQGILAVLSQFHYNIEEMCGQKGDKPLLVLLEDLQDPGNLGTIFRAGEGAGITGVIMSKDTVDIYNSKTIRSTMGSIFRIPFAYTEDLQGTIATLKKQGISCYAAHLKAEKVYDKCDFTSGTAFLIGNEGRGLTDEVTKAAGSYLKIPMEGQVESLNASVATAVLVYEAARQRRN